MEEIYTKALTEEQCDHIIKLQEEMLDLNQKLNEKKNELNRYLRQINRGKE